LRAPLYYYLHPKLLLCFFDSEKQEYRLRVFEKSIVDLVKNKDNSKLNLRTTENKKCLIDLKSFSAVENNFFNLFDINQYLTVLVDYTCDRVYHQPQRHEFSLTGGPFYLCNESRLIFVSKLGNDHKVSYVIKDSVGIPGSEEYRIYFENHFKTKPNDNVCIKIVSPYFDCRLKNHLCFKVLDFCTNIDDINDFDKIMEKVSDFKERRLPHKKSFDSTDTNKFEIENGFWKNYYIVPLCQKKLENFFQDLPDHTITQARLNNFVFIRSLLVSMCVLFSFYLKFHGIVLGQKNSTEMIISRIKINNSVEKSCF